MKLEITNIGASIMALHRELREHDGVRCTLDGYPVLARVEELVGVTLRADTEGELVELVDAAIAALKRRRNAYFEPLPPGPFGVIVADPPWQFEARGHDGLDRSPQKHYPCAATADICALPVHEIAAKDCVLLLWATWPMLPAALQVLHAWGFRYTTGGPWLKTAPPKFNDADALPVRPSFGTGLVLRQCSEPFLVGFRGRPPVRTAGEGGVMAEPGAHSAKPDILHRIAEKSFAGPFVELFARGPARDKWIAWGNEAEGGP